MNSIKEKLSAEIPENSKLLIAVSGGLDSIVLLDLVAQLKECLSLTIEVIHVNHRLRTDSEKDALFVESVVKKYGFTFHLKEVIGKIPDANIEAWARKVRYDLIGQVMSEREIDFVLTAHTADDVAETLLMRLVSNKELLTIHKSDPARKLLRPLLEISRAEIVAYAKSKNLEYVEDESNLDTRFLRNRTRHLLIPFLEEKFNPNIKRILTERAVSIGR